MFTLQNNKGLLSIMLPITFILIFLVFAFAKIFQVTEKQMQRQYRCQTYGKEGFILKGKGLYLHAYSLEFIHPFTDVKIRITDDLPERFTKIFGTL